MASYPTFTFPSVVAYVVLAWDVRGPTYFNSIPETAIRKVFEDREYAELAPRVVVIRISSPAERDQIAAVLDYLATKEHPGQFTYAISPAYPPSVWTGRLSVDWDRINAITLGTASSPAAKSG